MLGKTGDGYCFAALSGFRGSSRRISEPPGPETMSLRKCSCDLRRRATSARRSSTLMMTECPHASEAVILRYSLMFFSFKPD
jgi:hypothetical protein